MNEKQNAFYHKLRHQISKWLRDKAGLSSTWSHYLLLAPDLFYLLTCLVRDPEVPSSKKVKIGAAIAYFISPFDFIPEALIGPVGYLDDIAVAVYVLNDVINNVDPQVIRRHWTGDGDILLIVKTILINSDQLVGSGVWKKIRKKF